MPQRWMVVAGVLAVAGAGATWALLRKPDEVASRGGILDYRCDDPGKVYVGRLPVIRNPAVVTSQRVYDVLPEFQQIRAEGLRDDVPRYGFLMKAASDRFLQALRGLAARLGHDVVTEVGAIRTLRSDVPAPPDLTDQLLREVGGR